MAQNVLDELLAIEQAKLESCDFQVAELESRLDCAILDREKQAGIVRGVEMAIERLAGQPAEG